MSVFAGPLFAAAALLGAAGARKLADPAPTRIALRTAGLPGTRLLARLIGLGELSVAVFAVLRGGRPAAGLVALAYLAFAGFTRLVMVRGGRNASCGCFGSTDTPVSSWHVGVDLAIATTAVLAAVFPTAGLATIVRDHAAQGLVLAAFALGLAWLLQVLLTLLPDLWAAAVPPRQGRLAR